MTRQQSIKIRVTQKEKAEFEALAARAGLSLSALIRQRLSGIRIRPSIVEQERNRQLARIGNNLNQLARWANVHKNAFETIQLVNLLEVIRREINQPTSTIVEGKNVN